MVDLSQPMGVGGSLPVISIVIPCRGHAKELAHCLKGLSLQQDAPPFETIVVDSARDPAVEAAVAVFPFVTLVPPTTMLSAGAARNLGVRHGSGEILGFIDADCIPEPGWAMAALQAIQDGAALASGPILDVLPWNFIAASDNRLQFVDFPRWRPAGRHPYLPGAHLVMPRAVFESSGGFDEAWSVTQDVLFSQRVATDFPSKVRFDPRMRVRHWGRRTWEDYARHQWEFGSSRAEYRLRMNRSLTWLGIHPALAWVVLLRRFAYLTLRVLEWNLPDLPRYLLQLPVILVGLLAWTRGFYKGMQTYPLGHIQSGTPARTV